MSGERDPHSGWYQELKLKFQDGTAQMFYLHFSRSGRYIPTKQRAHAAWTNLSFHKCPGCTLPNSIPSCPAALSMEQTLAKLEGHLSTEVVTATAVDGDERVSQVTWPLQRVGAVFVQLAVFSSGCPIGDGLRPYLKDLRPFATMTELTRHIAGKMLLKHRGNMEISASESKRHLEPMHTVFKHLLQRLQHLTTTGDAIPNSVVGIDALSQFLAFQIEQICGQIGEELGWTPAPPKTRPPKSDASLWGKLKSRFGI
ncbi:MAG: hypothetical protein HY059_22480 [Proteobacteria bacterium]|nr:hypothetical protein [Pseudomonadota bacterium]